MTHKSKIQQEQEQQEWPRPHFKSSDGAKNIWMAEPQGGGGGGRGGSAKSLNFPDFFYFDGTPNYIY